MKVYYYYHYYYYFLKMAALLPWNSLKKAENLRKCLNGIIDKVLSFSDQTPFITTTDMLICLMTLNIPLN